MQVALFGGAFDPPHLGHVLCACWARSAGGVDAVWVLPAANHPYGKDMLAWEKRWSLCQLAFEGFGFVEVRDDELRNPNGRTFDLVQQLSAAHPDHEWALIGGSDTREDLPNWYRGEELRDMVDIIAVPRRGFDDNPAALPEISSTLIRERIANGEDITGLVPATVQAAIAARSLYH